MELADEIREATWKDFLESQSESSIFQSPALYRVYEKTSGFRPFVFASEAGNEIRALVSGAIVSISTGKLGRFASRAVVVGAPIGETSSFAPVLDALDQLAGKFALCTQIRNLRPPRDRSIFESRGYSWEDHLNFIMNLDQPEELLMRAMSKARRKAVETGNRTGLALVEVGSEELASAYELLHQTHSRAGIPLADQSLFRNALEILGESGQLWALGASRSGSLCAVRFVLRWKTTLFDWYAGSSQIGRASHADEWLVWQVFLKGIQAGCIDFDFGGAGKPGSGYGPGEFKRRFGGRSVYPGRFTKTYHPLALRTAETMYRLWRMWRET